MARGPTGAPTGEQIGEQIAATSARRRRRDERRAMVFDLVVATRTRRVGRRN